MTLKTRHLDSSFSERKFAYEFTTNNNFFSCKQNYYCIVILFLCFVFPFTSKDFVFPLLRWSILLFKLERIKKKEKSQRFYFKNFPKHIVSDGQMKLILKHKCTFIWCSYHFNPPFCVILQYPQSKWEILHRKEKKYSFKLHDFFSRILCRMDIYSKRRVIYQSGSTMNISHT